ncbi:MAG: Zn-dependent hydrolase [Candidatus Dormibacteraeota bacterium]|nr:Zn-dependent hydrolase [Candidatus Dormibacteraeota bacterium]MBO0760941.1 Zn-dependent hydrolase [Candidatus Dormibacteraeota bacterium]
MKGPTIDAGRMLDDLDQLNRCGADPGPGISRVAFSAADLEGRALVETWLRELGLAVSRDAAGNTVARAGGAEPELSAIALGSHTDTVPEGGRFDGALGVVAAVACARALATAGARLRHPLEVLNFVAEEATMGAGTLGSRAMAGLLDGASLHMTAWDGRTLVDHLAEAGIDPGGMTGARRPKGELAAYLELHIEQGGVLEAEGRRLGIVTGIVGIRRFRVVFKGRANHAGTTPMTQREDALVQAAPFVTGARDVALAHGVVSTVGTVLVHPGSPNVIPGRVELGCEVRSLDRNLIDQVEAELGALAERLGGALDRTADTPPVRSSEGPLEALRAAATAVGQPVRELASGAGHDAMSMAAITDQAMLFVPSRDGVSHAPAEHTQPEDCELGANALLAAVLELDRAS